MRKIFTLLIVAILATATSWAAEPYKTALFGKDYNSKEVNGYTDSWSATNAGFTVNLQYWSNYNNAWNYVKAGRKKVASVATITTANAIDKAINKVAVTVSAATVASINSTKLYVASDAAFSKDVQTITVKPAVGTLEFVVPKPAANQYYKFEADCQIKSNGIITVDKLEYYAADVPEKKVKSLAITGEPTNKEYYVGDAFSADGLKVNATYDDATQEDVTTKATWAFTPATFTEAGAVSVTATATYGGVSAQTTCPVTVKTIANTKEKAYTVEQAIALIDAGKDLATPVYVKGIVSEITTPYSAQYKNISFNVSDDGTTTVPQFEFFRNQKDAENKYAEDPNIEVGATVIGYGILKKFNDTYEFDAGNYLVEYIAPVAKTLQSIAISGEPAKTEYTEGETFSAEGLTVTATYDDASTAVVTDDATWSFEPATLAAGTTSVTATAKYNDKTASETYNVTVKEIPTYTYTWMVNGTEVKKSVLKEGAAVEAPANPENIADKVFTGWVTTATVDANVAPTYATIDETAKANTTYYAVFATLKQGAGEKWVKKAASEITEEGVYALITQNGNAFNGEIKSGHGQSTATTFVFDKNNEATSAPEGTCELTFVKKGEGYSINRDGTNIYKYLYSDGVGSGKLKWAVAEQNYWYYDEAKGSWAYKVKATETAYLNVYNTNNTFRTYYQAGTTSPVYFAQKVSGAGYADFTTIVKAAEVTTLANLAENGAEGAAYQVNDVMVVAKMFQRNNKNYIVVKDAAKAVRNFSTPVADDKFFNINGNKQEEYAQNNWMLVSLPVELYNQVNEKSTVTSITGTLTEKLNVAMEATNVVFENVTNDDFAPNTYCPINFLGKSSVKGANPAYTSSYYFATPKANEYANVLWAVYNATDGAFYLPTHQGVANAQEFKAAFKVDYSLNSSATPALTNGNVYSFEALVKEVAVATTDAKSAPRKVAYDSTVTPSTKFVVYPLDLDADKVATGVNDVNCAKEVKGVSYFNMMGVESAQPFDGVNIMVTTYTDGTSSATKVLR